MPNPKVENAIWSEAQQDAWFDRWSNPDHEEGSEPGLISTNLVCDRLELFGTPYREPIIPRHEPAPVILVEDKASVSLSQRALKALQAAPLSKREVRAIRREYKLEQLALEERLKTEHFAAELAPLPPSPPRVRDKMFRAMFQSQLSAFQAE